MNAIVPAGETLARAVPVRAEHERHRFTLDDVSKMVEAGIINPDARIELLDGELIDMPGEGPPHVWIKTLIGNYLTRCLPERYAIMIDSTLELAEGDAPDPDIYVVEDGKPLAPIDLTKVRPIVEVAESSISHDMVRKRRKYASYGLQDYWFVDVGGACTHVFDSPGPATMRLPTRSALMRGLNLCVCPDVGSGWPTSPASPAWTASSGGS